MHEPTITFDEAVRRIAYSRRLTLAAAAELVAADIELLETAAALESPPPIDPPPPDAKPQATDDVTAEVAND